MINDSPNMSRKQIFGELPSPSQLEKQEEPKMLLLIYKAVYIGVKLLLDVRLNLVKISENKTIKTGKVKKKKFSKPSNAVIKDEDMKKLKVKDKENE